MLQKSTTVNTSSGLTTSIISWKFFADTLLGFAEPISHPHKPLQSHAYYLDWEYFSKLYSQICFADAVGPKRKQLVT